MLTLEQVRENLSRAHFKLGSDYIIAKKCQEIGAPILQSTIWKYRVGAGKSLTLATAGKLQILFDYLENEEEEVRKILGCDQKNT